MPLTGVDNIVTGYLGFGAVKFVGYTFFGFYLAKKYEHEPMPVQFDAQNRVAQDFSCKLCGYNLRTLLDSGACPECGGTVAATLRAHTTRQPEDLRTNPFFIGFLRTIIGLAFGTMYWHFVGGMYRPPAVLGLMPIRIIEWWLLIFILFDPKLKQRRRGWIAVIQGMCVSYLLDIPAMLGFCITGGVGIC